MAENKTHIVESSGQERGGDQHAIHEASGKPLSSGNILHVHGMEIVSWILHDDAPWGMRRGRT